MMPDDKKINRKIPEQISRRVVEISLSNPDMGAQRLLALLRQEDIHISKSSVYRIMRRNDINTRDKRMKKQVKQLAPSLSISEKSASLPSPNAQGNTSISIPEKPKQNSAKQNREILNRVRSLFRHQCQRFIIRVSSSFITLLNVALLLLLGFMGYQTIEKIRNDQTLSIISGSIPANDDISAVNSSRHPNPALSVYRSIWERNLFNVSSEVNSLQKKPIDFANVADADKKIGLKLLGTVMASVSANRFAIIEDHQDQNVYHEGDRARNFVIKRILRNNVIIATEEGNKLLALKSDDFDRKTAVASSLLSSQTPSKTFKPGKSGGRFKKVELPREEIMVAFDDIDGLIQEVGTSSYKFGRLTGFKIGSVSDESILKKIGLRSHDKILALNDKSIADESEAYEFFEKIGDGEEVTITFRRRNRTRRIELKPI